MECYSTRGSRMNNYPIDVWYEWKMTLLNRLLNGLKYLGTTVFLNSLDACVYRMVLVRSPRCRYAIRAHRAIEEIYDAIKLGQS